MLIQKTKQQHQNTYNAVTKKEEKTKEKKRNTNNKALLNSKLSLSFWFSVFSISQEIIHDLIKTK